MRRARPVYVGADPGVRRTTAAGATVGQTECAIMHPPLQQAGLKAAGRGRVRVRRAGLGAVLLRIRRRPHACSLELVAVIARAAVLDCDGEVDLPARHRLG